MKIFRYAPIAAVALFVAAPAMAQDTGSQALTYQIEAINEISVSGTPSLVISEATAGDQPDAVSDALSTYDITTNEENQKITIALDAAPADGVTLTALLGEPAGASATTVTFTEDYRADEALDAVTGITEVAESGLSITYGISAPVTAGVIGEQTVNVTYTIVDGS